MATILDDPNEFVAMEEGDREQLLTWIAEMVSPRKTVLRQSSYYLKHLFERDRRVYVTNGEFKGAMRSCGYEPVNEGEQNWLFRVNVKRVTRW